MNSEIIFENDNKTARLIKYNYNNIDIINESIKYVDSLLIIKPIITIYGKNCEQKRDVGFFSNVSTGYNYSNKVMQSQPLNNSLTFLLNNINEIFKSNYNGILVNKYENGLNYIGAHSDNEKNLDLTDGVATLSICFGKERLFRIRDKNNKKIVFETKTTNNSILVMQ